MANIKTQVQSISPIVVGEGDYGYPGMSKIGQLFTADWKTKLALAGRAYSLNLGTGGTHLAGNAAFDADQPEFLVAADSGWLVPMELSLAANADLDAEESLEVTIVSDRTQAQAAGATATVEVPLNLLDGGPAFGGRAWSVVTGNLTAVTEADILYAATYKAVQVSAVSTIDAAINVDHVWTTPIFLAAPCMIIGYVHGTATASAFSGRLTFAHLPSSWISVS
jgi:hypothetical protein